MINACPTQRELPHMMECLKKFNSDTCRFATYSSQALSRKDQFDQWSSDDSLCDNCKRFL